jgi:hypothetical protein
MLERLSGRALGEWIHRRNFRCNLSVPRVANAAIKAATDPEENVIVTGKSGTVLAKSTVDRALVSSMA